MHYVVTGATGFIGQHLCHRLMDLGHKVTAVYRDQGKFLRLQRTGLIGAKGDVTDLEFLQAVLRGADGCFHLAAIARPWAARTTDFFDVNVTGTRNVLQAAIENRVGRVVFTSTASVFGPADASDPATEATTRIAGSTLPYDETKRQCEKVVKEFLDKQLDVVSVYPTRVFGPGELSESNALTRIIKQYLDGKWRWLPGSGTNVGNYVYVLDCVEGHIRAMTDGVAGHRYILGGDNLSFIELTDGMNKVAQGATRFYSVPRFVLLGIAGLQGIRARITGTRPMLTTSTINKFLQNWHVDCSKAKLELGYRTRPYLETLSETMDWIRTESSVPRMRIELKQST